MPIDPTIALRGDSRIPLSALGAQPQQLDVAGTIYRAQAAHAMQAEAQRKQQEAQKQQQIDALAAQYEDPEDYIAAVNKIDPFYAAKVGEQFEKVKKEKLEGHIKTLDLGGKKLDYYIRTAQAAGEDPDQYAIWRQDMVQRDPSMEPMLPQPAQWVDPEVRRRFFAMGDTLANSVKLERDTADKFIKGDYRKGLLDAVAGAPTIDVARGILDAAKGFAPKGDIAYVNGILASAPDFETARQQAAEASGTKAYQQVVLDENGERIIGAFDPKTADVISTGVKAGPLAGEVNEPLVGIVGPNGRPILVPRSQAAGKTPAPTGSGGDSEPLVPIVGPDGKPVLVRRSQAEGKTPASTRDSGGGRGVTSGDANRMADFDTSLDDVAVLRTAVTGNQATGARAAAGAALPNWVTEITGWGADAKSKQAVIDRVKQVIGKALEGGVLRKEDEYKYEKILPTISDPPSLVQSKLNGLESAIKQRRERLLESLDDAGYNTESYKTRGTTPPPPSPKTAPKVGEVITVRGKKVKVTRVLADGRYEGEVLP